MCAHVGVGGDVGIDTWARVLGHGGTHGPCLSSMCPWPCVRNAYQAFLAYAQRADAQPPMALSIPTSSEFTYVYALPLI